MRRPTAWARAQGTARTERAEAPAHQHRHPHAHPHRHPHAHPHRHPHSHPHRHPHRHPRPHPRLARLARSAEVGGRPRADDTGSGTVLTLGLVAVAAVLIAVVALLAGAQGARGRAQAGADLAALAAAQHLLDHGGTDVATACEVAQAVARRNGVRVSSCRGDGSGVVTVTTVRTSPSGPATARARAGPVAARG